MKLPPLHTDRERPDILRARHAYGMWYGLTVGFVFAVFAWGIDGYLLSMSHGMYPWLKFSVGAAACALMGGAAGWLAARSNKPLPALLIWLVVASAFAWLTLNLPVRIQPRLLSMLESQAGEMLRYSYYEIFGAQLGVSYFWLALIVALAGLMQIPLSESAVFSTSVGGKLGPLLVAAILMYIGGTIVDGNLVNEPMRAPLMALDETIQYVIDHRGGNVDRAEWRRMHAASLNTVAESVTQERKLIVSSYDESFGEVNVLVKFEKDWVECSVFYNQPLSCEAVEGSP
ncbi:hypothetical protein FBQ81_17800 [Chloroflexi bacterium CFX6]|nr:hypothetical protein [Chloroflexi bacterium CFX6]